jgi:hypothetical protein
MKYHYNWQPLKIVPTYIKPEEPKLELKEEYTPEYKERIADPVKKDHLTYLNHLDLKEENDDNEPTVPTTEEVTPTIPETTPEETTPASPVVHSSSNGGGGSSSRPVTIIETSPSIEEEEVIEEIPTPVIEESTTAFDEGVRGVDRPMPVGRDTPTGDTSTSNRNLIISLSSCFILVMWLCVFCKMKFFDFLKKF